MNIFFGALDPASFCADDAVQKIFGLIGTFIIILRWAIPVMLIIWGSLDLGKAVVEQDPKKIKEGYSTLMKRAVAALIFFFIPPIVGLLINAVDGSEDSMQTCTTLLRLEM